MGTLENVRLNGSQPVPPLAQADPSPTKDIVDTYSEDSPKFQSYCPTQINPNIFGALPSSPADGMIPDLWVSVERALNEKLEKNCYSPGDLIDVTVGGNRVVSTGFVVHGIKLCFGNESTASAKMRFKVADDGSLRLNDVRFIFSRPVLAALNLKIPVGKGIDAFFREGKCLSEATSVKLADMSAVKPYNSKDAGTFTKPVILAFDTANIFSENGQATLVLELNSKEFTSKGWGTFTFGADEDGCEEKGKCSASIRKKNPGVYLGNVVDEYGEFLGGGACRNTYIGGVIRKAMVKWLMGDWGREYDEFQSKSGGDPMLSFAATLNLKMNMGSGECNWDSLKVEEDVLGRIYNTRVK